MDAAACLSACYDARRAALPAAVEGRSTVAFVGRDVPREFILAAGFAAYRLTGDPHREPALADAVCGPGIDGLARSQLDRILRGDLANCRGLVISSDSEGSVRLYLYLRQLQRSRPRDDIPPFTLVDVLHLPHRTSLLYTRRQFDALAETLVEWGGDVVTNERLGAAIAELDALREQITAVGSLRRGPARIRGTQALRLIGASYLTSPSTWIRLARAACADAAQRPPLPGRRAFLTGSAHDHPRAYELLESHDVLIVGDDHDWGDLAGEPHPRARSGPRDALARAYGRGAPSAAGYGLDERAEYTARRARDSGAEFAICWLRKDDDAAAWDAAAQRAALRKHDIELTVLPAQPYATPPDPTLLRRVDNALGIGLPDPARAC